MESDPVFTVEVKDEGDHHIVETVENGVVSVRERFSSSAEAFAFLDEEFERMHRKYNGTNH